MHRRLRAWLALAVAGAGSSCGAPEPVNDETPSTALVQDASIADNGGGPAYEFTSITQVLERGDSVFIRQADVQEIRVFSVGGQHLATFGRNGSGPGEFRSLEAMGFLGDTLWTIDGDLRRLSYFTSAGTLLKTEPFEPVSPALGDGSVFFFPYFKMLLQDGTVLGSGGWAGRDIASGKVTATPQLRMTRTGQTLDTLGWVPIGNEHMIIQSDRARMYRMQPYGDAAILVYSSEASRVYVVDRPAAAAADTANVLVIAIDARGDTAWVSSLSYAPVRFDPVKVDSLRVAFHKIHSPRFTAEQVDRALYTPSFRPPVTGAISASDGALWIRWDDGTRSGGVTVLDRDGRTRAFLTIPARAKLQWASADRFWVEVKDENDVPTLVRYRLSSATKK